MNRSRPIYLDHHATTPVDPQVLEAMLPYFSEIFGNAASTDHLAGAEALEAVERARAQVARLVGARPEEIVFTSGATEANNLALLGVAAKREAPGHIITCVTEHPAVLDPCRYLEKCGWRVTYLGVDDQGRIDLRQLRDAITSQTALVSIMAANNEIGVIAPIAEIGAITQEAGVLFHTDATQAVGYAEINVESDRVDLLSLSGHKIYGPKGVGALYVRRRSPRVRLAEQMHGGGHERGLRSGTLNVPGIVGLGAAAELLTKTRTTESARISALRDRLYERIRTGIEGTELNGPLEGRLPNNLNVVLPGIEARSLLVRVKYHVSLSTGSACSTQHVEPSHVIVALGGHPDRAHWSIRFGLGRATTVEEIDRATSIVVDAARDLRALVSSLQK